MKSIRTIVRPVVAALVFALAAAPMTAFAGDKANAAETKKGPQFPMTAESFNKHVEKRITRMRERLTKSMTERKVPEAEQAKIKKTFEDRAAAMRAAAKKAGSDGTVTQEEAQQLKGLAKDMKRAARAKHTHAGNKDKKRAL